MKTVFCDTKPLLMMLVGRDELNECYSGYPISLNLFTSW